MYIKYQICAMKFYMIVLSMYCFPKRVTNIFYPILISYKPIIDILTNEGTAYLCKLLSYWPKSMHTSYLYLMMACTTEHWE